MSTAMHMPRFSPLIFMAACLSLCAGQAPANGSEPQAERIRRSIAACPILPQDYRQHVNIVLAPEAAALSVNRAPDAKPNDCKIDAVLLAGKVVEADPSAKQVTVAFYDLSDTGTFWQAAVPCAAVKAYARGKLRKDQVLAAVAFSVRQANQLAKRYAGQSYKEITASPGVVDGPLQEARAAMLARIDKLQAGGANVYRMRLSFLHIEDLARRGRQPQVESALKELEAAVSRPGSPDTGLTAPEPLEPAASAPCPRQPEPKNSKKIGKP